MRHIYTILLCNYSLGAFYSSDFKRTSRGRYNCTLCNVIIPSHQALKHERSDRHAQRAQEDENIRQWWTVDPAQEACAWLEETPTSSWQEWEVEHDDVWTRVEKWRMQVCTVPEEDFIVDCTDMDTESSYSSASFDRARALKRWADSVPMLNECSDQRKQLMKQFLEVFIHSHRHKPSSHCQHIATASD